MRIIVYADLFDSSEIVYGRYTVSSIEEAELKKVLELSL